jgi:DNA polymerase III sliding clamp (beta) subunit (PCNA family)
MQGKVQVKIAAQILKEATRILNTVKADSFSFAGSAVYAVSQNITVCVHCPDIGVFGVGSEKFSQIIARLDGDLDISLLNGLGSEELNQTLTTQIVIKAKRSKLKLPLLAAPQVPKIILPNSAVAVLDLKQFNEMVSYAASASETRQNFSYTGAINLSGNGQKISAVGTDGKRLAVIDVENPAPRFSFIMPVPVIPVIKALRGETVSVYQDTTNLYFQSGGATIVARQLAKTFPSHESIIAKSFSIRSKIPVQEMKDALRRIQPVVAENDIITLTVTDTQCILYVVGNLGTAEDEIPATSIESDPLFDTFKFAIKHHQLQDFFNEVSGDVVLNANAEGAPIYLEAGARKLLCASLKS